MTKSEKNQSSPESQPRRQTRGVRPLLKNRRRGERKIYRMLTEEEKQIREAEQAGKTKKLIEQLPLPRASNRPRTIPRSHFSSGRSDMTKLLKLEEKFAKPKEVNLENPKNIYQCNFCLKPSSYKKECELHQNNMHFLENRKSHQYIVREELLKNSGGERASQYSLLFLRPKDETFKYFRCNHCDYTNFCERYLKEHLEKYCVKRPSKEKLGQAAPKQIQKMMEQRGQDFGSRIEEGFKSVKKWLWSCEIM